MYGLTIYYGNSVVREIEGFETEAGAYEASDMIIEEIAEEYDAYRVDYDYNLFRVVVTE